MNGYFEPDNVTPVSFDTTHTENTTDSRTLSIGTLYIRAMTVAQRLTQQYNAAYPAADPLTPLQAFVLLERSGWKCFITGMTYRDGGLIIARIDGCPVPVSAASSLSGIAGNSDHNTLIRAA